MLDQQDHFQTTSMPIVNARVYNFKLLKENVYKVFSAQFPTVLSRGGRCAEV